MGWLWNKFDNMHVAQGKFLENSLMKCVVGWTTMACHVDDPSYYKVMTIVICDMQFEEIEVQRIMWAKLNVTMMKHRF